MEDESQLSLSKRAGLAGSSLLRKYLAGSIPGTAPLVGLAEALDVRLEWLATGKGPMRETDDQAQRAGPQDIINMGLMETAIFEAEQGLKAMGHTLPPKKKAQLILAIYEILSEQGVSERSNVQIQRILRLVA